MGCSYDAEPLRCAAPASMTWCTRFIACLVVVWLSRAVFVAISEAGLALRKRLCVQVRGRRVHLQRAWYLYFDS